MPRAFTDAERRHVRARLERAAADRVAQTGFRRTSVADLARDAGISKGAFYAFYDSKEALFAELLRKTEQSMRAELQALAAGTGPDVLERVLGALASAVTTHPLLRVLTDPEESMALFRGLPPEALAEAAEDDDRWFSELFTALAERGVVPHDAVPGLVALPRLLFAVAQGSAALGDCRPALDLLLRSLISQLRGTP